MVKVAIILQENEANHKDLSHPELGNPGVGGTAFCFALLIKYLEEYTEQVDFFVYQLNDTVLPAEQGRVKRAEGLQDALSMAKEDGCEVMLLRNHQSGEDYALLKTFHFRYIFWMHNRLTYAEIRMFDAWEDVKRVIAVGNEMYDYYLDDPIEKKMDFVTNMFLPPDEKYLREKEYPLWVTYTGSLIYDKNFHMLAAVWKEVLKEVPEAQLHVIGSGKLYDGSLEMGPYGIADKEYEAMFMPGLCDEEGKILPSVVFHGIMGEEKNEVYQKSAIGVINPMATETFCLSAIEKEACGMPVVTRRKNGLLDTVVDGETGILYKDPAQLGPVLIKLLKDRTLNERLGKQASQFARNEFLPAKIMPKWVQVFVEVGMNKTASYQKPKKNMDNNGKRMRVFFHGLRKIPFLKRIPSLHDLQKK